MVMETLVLKEKIDNLPENLKEQVADYVDFLLYRYGSSPSTLTDEEKTELDERWAAYQQNNQSNQQSGRCKSATRKEAWRIKLRLLN